MISSPAGLAVEQPVVLIARKDLPASTLPEFVAYAKANHKKMQFGSAGVGSGSHFSCAKLNIALGIEPIHVPYRSSGLAAQDLMGGRLDFLCALGGTAMGPVESGQAKAIGLLTAERSPLFPTLRTSKEEGLVGVGFVFLVGVLLSEEHARRRSCSGLHAAADKTLALPITVERLRKTGIEPIVAARRSPAYLREFMKSRDAELGGDGEGQRHPAGVRRRPARELDNSRTKKGRREAGPKVENVFLFVLFCSFVLFVSQ